MFCLFWIRFMRLVGWICRLVVIVDLLGFVWIGDFLFCWFIVAVGGRVWLCLQVFAAGVCFAYLCLVAWFGFWFDLWVYFGLFIWSVCCWGCCSVIVVCWVVSVCYKLCVGLILFGYCLCLLLVCFLVCLSLLRFRLGWFIVFMLSFIFVVLDIVLWFDLSLFWDFEFCWVWGADCLFCFVGFGLVFVVCVWCLDFRIWGWYKMWI